MTAKPAPAPTFTDDVTTRATLLTGKIGDDCTVRYDFAEYWIMVDGDHVKTDGTRDALLNSLSKATTLAEAQEDARNVRRVLSGRAGYDLRSIRLVRKVGFVVIAYGFEQDLSEDGEGAIMATEKVLAGERPTHEPRSRDFFREFIAARAAAA